jgi:hypothetical protein
VTVRRAEALARLDALAGEWIMTVRFPGQPAASGAVADGSAASGPVARSWFEWTLDRQFLVQRTEVPVPGVPDSLAIIAADTDTGGYRQHYFDARGVARLYAMSLADGVWTLTRQSPDFTPLDFWQRFTATISADGDTISGAWEKCLDGTNWEHDFDLTYRRADGGPQLRG